MKLIVGLGNPGRKYEQTRHNVGFMVLEKLAVSVSAGPPRVQFEGQAADAMVASEKTLLLCPHTFMNASGQSVRKAVDFFKLQPRDLLVICDDLDLPVGRLRFKRDGSAGGQKGIADIIRHLKTEEFARLKVGIGRPPAGWETADYVLGKFTKSEREIADPLLTKASYAAQDWIKQGIAAAMNQHNSVGKPPKARKSKLTERTGQKVFENPAEGPDESESDR